LGRRLLRYDPLWALSFVVRSIGGTVFSVQSIGGVVFIGGTVFAVRSLRVHNVAQEELPEERVHGNARTH
jgi:hypothetical protein